MTKQYTSTLLKAIIWLSFMIAFFATGSYFFPLPIALVTSAISATVFIGTLIINEYWLFPKYYVKTRRKFILYNFIIIVILTIFHLSIESLFVSEILFPRMAEKMPFFFPIMRSFGMVSLGNFISITILLATELKRKAENEKLLKEEKLGTEIKLLKAQINPHFIFNALNNIYSLTYTKSEMAPESVLKLSEMLRYVFYDCSNDHVKLGAEIEYVSNFIAFQQMKSEHEQAIKFSYEGANKDIDVAPMLFIPFIENSFKYSKIEEYSDAYVKMNLNSDNKYLNLEIENSIPIQGKSLAGNGLGIKNVRQRLDLLYPNKYDLNISENETTYSVNLKIEMK
jgi:two-component system, LytTR family, sensor kinase